MCVEINEKTAMVRLNTHLERFVTAGLHSVDQVGRYQAIIDAIRATCIGCRFGKLGVALKEYVDKTVVHGNTSHTGPLVHWFIEVTHEDGGLITRLAQADEFVKVAIEIFAWLGFGFFNASLAQKTFLLVISGGAAAVGRFCAYLVCRNKGDEFLIFAHEFDPCPTAQGVATSFLDATYYVALGHDHCAAGFVEFLGRDGASGQLERVLFEGLACRVLEAFADGKLVGVQIVFCGCKKVDIGGLDLFT